MTKKNHSENCYFSKSEPEIQKVNRSGAACVLLLVVIKSRDPARETLLTLLIFLSLIFPFLFFKPTSPAILKKENISTIYARHSIRDWFLFETN